MPVIYVYNPANDTVEYFNRNTGDPMPYIAGNTLSVGEFISNSYSNTAWTDRRTMEAWNVFRSLWGRAIYVGYVFKRIWQGGHTGQSQHYAGMAFDIGQNLDSASRNLLRDTAYRSGVWSYIEPAYLTPTWVHVDKRMGIPACAEGGFPTLTIGSKGVYVFVLQDALNALGYTTGGLDGYFGKDTINAVMNFQRLQGLSIDGIAGCTTWERLTSATNGIGLTGTVINP